MSNNSRSGAAKVVPRSLRSETRNRAKEELKRVINALDKVRKWERRWVVLKDSSINVYKWVPVTGQSMITTMKPTVKPLVTVGEETNQSTISAENSNDETNVTATSRNNFNEDSNAAFSEVGFDSDSNQTGTFDRVDYKQAGDSAVGDRVGSGGGKQTDFSQMVAEEAANSRQRDADSGGSGDGASNQSSPLPPSRKRAADSPSRAASSRKSSKH